MGIGASLFFHNPNLYSCLLGQEGISGGMSKAFQRLELDIGTGRGDFAVEAAKERPDTKFIGLDINQYQLRIAERKRLENNLENLEFIHAEAMVYLVNHTDDRSVNDFHIYFPTPYSRTIRRDNELASEIYGWMLSPSFLDELVRCAAPGATLRFATDHERYFEHAIQMVQVYGLRPVRWIDPIKNARLGLLIGTGCEKAQTQAGHVTRYLQCLL